MTASDWFLSPAERGNAATKLDARRGDGAAHTEGNEVRVLVHGAEYFARLLEELNRLDRDDWVHFTDWRGDPDERLDGPGTEIAACSPGWPAEASTSAASFGGRTPIRLTSASRRTSTWSRR